MAAGHNGRKLYVGSLRRGCDGERLVYDGELKYDAAVNMRPPLLGRRVQIAGSASPANDPARLQYAHDLINLLARKIMRAGGGLVFGAGKEPRAPNATSESPSLIFDWTILEAVAACLKEGCGDWPLSLGLPIVVVTSEKGESEIPEARRSLWKELLVSGRVRVESILPGARSGALLRERQASFGDSLVILGGGTGVEHLAQLYLAARKPVIPLDLPLGASRGDGTGGAERLAREARACPGRFIRLASPNVGSENASLAALSTTGGTAPPIEAAEALMSLLRRLAPPTAFYVRLLNRDHEKFKAVEAFFRNVVDPLVEAAGMSRVEMSTDKTEHPFINVGIFESLHFSSLAVVDVTGARPNCFIELGYALGQAKRVLVTAEEGTSLPFDQQAIPCHFWKASADDTLRQKELAEFWQKNVDRPPIVAVLE